MEWVCKGALTVCSVAVVLALAQRWGRSAAGFIAGLPTTTAPALLWVARDHGTGFAIDAARVTVTACAVLALFALFYAHLSGRARPLLALGGAAAAALLLAWPVLAASGRIAPAVAIAVGCCALTLTAWPRRSGTARRAHPPPASKVIASTASGGIAIGVALAVPALGAVVAGLLSSLPVVSASVAITEHAAGGRLAVLQFLRGCVAGLLGRIAFGAVFAATLGSAGVAWALGLAALCACGANLVAALLLCHRGPPGVRAVGDNAGRRISFERTGGAVAGAPRPDASR